MSPKTSFCRSHANSTAGETSRLISEERKQFGQFGLVRAPAVFADLEGFGVFDSAGAVFAVPLFQLAAKAVRDGLIAPGETVTDLLLTLLLLLRVGGKQIRGAIRAAFVELGD